jgi:predicted nucleic acid-binding protein
MNGDMVFDACAIAKLLFLETGSVEARALAAQAERVITCELAFSEVSNVALKKLRRDGLSRADVSSVVQDCKELIDSSTPIVELAEDALALALNAMVSVYDASYVVLAMRAGAPLVTADAALSRAMAGVDGAPRILLLPA